MFISLGLFPFSYILAQEQGFSSPSEAVSRFYETSLLIDEVSYVLEASKIRIDSAKKGRNFTLGSNLTTRISENGIVRSIDTPFQDSRSIGAGITLRKPIIDFGRTSSDVSLRRISSERVESTINSDLNNQVYKVLIAYADVEFYRNQLRIIKSRKAQLVQQLQWADMRYSLGKASRTDVLQVQSALTSVEATIAGAENNLISEERNFATIVGDQPGNLGVFNIDEYLPKSLPEALSRLTQNSELKTLSLIVRELEAEKIKIGTQNKPRVDLTVGYTTELGASQSFVSPDSLVAIGTLSIPLIDGGRNKLNRTEVSARRSAAISRLTRRRFELEGELLEVWDSIKVAQRQIKLATNQVEIAEATHSGALLEQELGRRSTLDVLFLQNNALTAKISLARFQQSLSHAQSRLVTLLNQNIKK